ncbi:LysR substrate-binding domain-containing protein [Methyloraptor flagellatus]|uniref:LysR substrate-binding domain-containing protein n=1 Tax=Methyloraptor flagellatus TaxID=3162530 RepID=A0AAU7X9Z4_9HYPH
MLDTIPLSTIRAFEAAARTGSFRSAANELHLTPSAVSHAIRKLESLLGATLFRRDARTVTLTPAGEALMTHVSAAFEELRRGVALVTKRGPQILRLHAAPSFAAKWLSPRLARFLALEPGIEVRLAAGTDYARFVNDDFDVDIVYGVPRADGAEYVPLVEETMTPLCAPELASRIRTPRDLYGEVLIRSEVKRVQWHHWFTANGLEPPAAHGMRFDRSFLALAAAADGVGVAMESTLLAERELADGRLVAPLRGRSEDVRYIGHYLAFPKGNRQRRVVRAFTDWIQHELGLA